MAKKPDARPPDPDAAALKAWNKAMTQSCIKGVKRSGEAYEEGLRVKGLFAASIPTAELRELMIQDHCDLVISSTLSPALTAYFLRYVRECGAGGGLD